MGYGHQKLGSSISAPSGQITTQKDGTGVSTVGLVSALYHSTDLRMNMLQDSAIQDKFTYCRNIIECVLEVRNLHLTSRRFMFKC